MSGSAGSLRNVIPKVGLGVAGISPQTTAARVLEAVDAGYRLIDTATIYKNEAEVGDAIAQTPVPRDELFITTKVWPDMYGPGEVERSFEESLVRLRLERLDLFLLHWPAPALDRYVENWRVLIDLKNAGRVSHIGVSNFFPEQLERLEAETGEMPANNQLELHPYSQRQRELAFHEQHDIITECWSPLGRSKCLIDPVVVSIADRLGRSPAQVILRWHFEGGRVSIPRSNSLGRIRDNIDIGGFSLTPDDHASIAKLDRGLVGKLGPDPEVAA